MKTIKIYNADTKELLKEFKTRKQNYNSIQDEVINECKKMFNNRLWVQGKINFFNREQNNCLLGGNLWWIVAGFNGRLQFTME